jgi:serine protease
MMKRCVCWAAAALALAYTPSAAARVVSVGYRTPAALHGLRVVSSIPALDVAVVRVPSSTSVRELRARPGIRFVHRLVPRHRTEEPTPSLAAVASPAPGWQWAAAHADAVPTWVQDAAASRRIAVVDTGADMTVPALAAKSALTWNVTTGSAAVHDQVGHGTFVASLAAGSSTGFGGSAQLSVVQANRGGSGFTDVDEANAIVWAVDHGANIVNLSIGGSQTSTVERAAVKYAIGKGVLLVAAAGNAALQGNPAQYPAALIGRQGLVVGAADREGRRAAFSSTGAWVDLLAPGVDVVGAIAGGIGAGGYFGPTSTAGYGLGSGTSYASPEVAGAAALVWAAAPSLTASGVAHVLEATATGSGFWSRDAGFGNLDVGAAVASALGGAPPAIAVASQPPAPARARKTPNVQAAAKKHPRARPR